MSRTMDGEIYIVNADGTGQPDVTNNPADVFEYPGRAYDANWAP